MKLGDILVCIDGSTTGRERTEFALALAARSGARLTGYFLPPPKEVPINEFIPSPPTRTYEDASDDFERELASRKVEGAWVPGTGAHAVKDIVAHARCADLVVVGLGIPDDAADDPQHLDIERLIIDCGRPVLGVPIASFTPEVGKKIMVAWDGSRECARAVHDALPFLRDATSVTVTALDSDPLAPASANSLVEHLTRLGVPAALDKEIDLEMAIGEEILSRIEREKIDLLVAGAFGHSRLWEHLVGGTSLTLLHQMMVPVLVSH